MTVLPRTTSRARTVLQLLPSYGRHLLFQPYRLGLRSIPGGRAWEIAAYDLFLNFLLSGYTELTGQPIRRGAAQLLILVNRIAFLVDDEFERRIQTESVEFDELAATKDISRTIADMRTYLDVSCDAARRDAIRQALRRTVETDYRRYVMGIERRRTGSSVADLLEDATVDCGAVMRQLAQVVGLFHGFAAPLAALEDFNALGLACKFADDLRDWHDDSQTGAGNILLAILARYPDESQRLARARKSGLRMNEKRWNRLCPETFTEFANLYGEYYARIRSNSLRSAADLMMETGRVGYLPKSSRRTAARA